MYTNGKFFCQTIMSVIFNCYHMMHRYYCGIGKVYLLNVELKNIVKINVRGRCVK
jgi:hypothetical protein